MEDKTIGAGRDAIRTILKSIKGGEFFSIKYIRTAPKCLFCEKSDASWTGREKCPICGKPLSHEREALAQLKVFNPKNSAIKPKGTGETAKEALANGRLKYFEPLLKNQSGSIDGNYRQCRIENIISLKCHGKKYRIIG